MIENETRLNLECDRLAELLTDYVRDPYVSVIPMLETAVYLDVELKASIRNFKDLARFSKIDSTESIGYVRLPKNNDLVSPFRIENCMVSDGEMYGVDANGLVLNIHKSILVKEQNLRVIEEMKRSNEEGERFYGNLLHTAGVEISYILADDYNPEIEFSI